MMTYIQLFFYSLPEEDQAGLLVTTPPTPPSIIASIVTFNWGETLTDSMAHNATATVLRHVTQVSTLCLVI